MLITASFFFIALYAGRIEEEHATAKHLGFMCLTTLAKEKPSPEFFYSLFRGLYLGSEIPDSTEKISIVPNSTCLGSKILSGLNR